MDADYADKMTDTRSVSGGVIVCWGLGFPEFQNPDVRYTNNYGSGVSCSGRDDNEFALSEVGMVLYLAEVGPMCVPVFEDKEGAVQLALNIVINSNSKHIDVRSHFQRKHVST